jgi:oxygen-independent coproporphyrinogen-3 oxidase
MIADAVAAPPSPRLFEAPAQLGDPVGVYIHVPFCSHICPYCDFNTYAGQSALIPDYVAAATREIDSWAPRFEGRIAESIFLGGGTPSQLSVAHVGSLLATCRSTFDLTRYAEISLEANPNDLSENYCAGLLDAGVTRLSIGGQTLDRRGLRVLGRRHEAADTARAVAAARAAGFSNVSLDLMYGWPGQTSAQWRQELERVLAGEIGGAAPDHLSLYGLIVEPGTPMADAVHRGIFTPADDDAAAELYEIAGETLISAGWRQYEIANWSTSSSTVSHHNAIYWRNGDYAGIGAGAHAYAEGMRSMNQPSPKRYIAALAAGRSPVTNVEAIDARTAMGETMMLGLRLVRDGVSAQAFEARHGISLWNQFGAQIAMLEHSGLLERSVDAVRLTPRGALLANSVCAEFV